MGTHADGAAASYASLSATHEERFLLGAGVSHAHRVDALEPGRYRRPPAAMTAFLDGLDTADEPVPSEGRALAALGPKMLEVVAKRARGVYPYLVTPEHTRRAREAVGDGGLVLPEQAVVLAADADGGDWPDQRDECLAVVEVGGGDADRQRQALAVDDEGGFSIPSCLGRSDSVPSAAPFEGPDGHRADRAP